MNLKSYLIDMIESSHNNLFRAVRAMPEDKLTWKVEGKGRSALEQLQECAQSPMWFKAVLDNIDSPPEFSEADFGKMMEERQQWDTVDKCEAACKKNMEGLIESIKQFPEEKMSQKVKLQFREEPFEAADMILGTYWNNTYHIGQINFIQTLYGDSDMH